jgi:hypothetical protein
MNPAVVDAIALVISALVDRPPTPHSRSRAGRDGRASSGSQVTRRWTKSALRRASLYVWETDFPAALAGGVLGENYD